MINLCRASHDDLIALIGWAILGYVSFNIREIGFEYSHIQNKLIISYFFDNPPTETELDSIGCIEAELITQSGAVDFDFKIYQIPYPHAVPHTGYCIYRRYESASTYKSVSWTNLMVAANQAMLGRIHENIREISLSYAPKAKRVKFFVCFEASPTQHQLLDVDWILAAMSDSFSRDIFWEKQIVVLPLPAHFSQGEKSVYCRAESYSYL